jgi:hypothetical protein
VHRGREAQIKYGDIHTHSVSRACTFKSSYIEVACLGRTNAESLTNEQYLQRVECIPCHLRQERAENEGARGPRYANTLKVVIESSIHILRHTVAGAYQAGPYPTSARRPSVGTDIVQMLYSRLPFETCMDVAKDPDANWCGAADGPLPHEQRKLSRVLSKQCHMSR